MPRNKLHDFGQISYITSLGLRVLTCKMGHTPFYCVLRSLLFSLLILMFEMEVYLITAILYFHPIKLLLNWSCLIIDGLSRRLSSKESVCQCRVCKRCEFDSWLGKIPWRRKWQHTPVFSPGEFHGQRSLVGYSP